MPVALPSCIELDTIGVPSTSSHHRTKLELAHPSWPLPVKSTSRRPAFVVVKAVLEVVTWLGGSVGAPPSASTSLASAFVRYAVPGRPPSLAASPAVAAVVAELALAAVVAVSARAADRARGATVMMLFGRRPVRGSVA